MTIESIRVILATPMAKYQTSLGRSLGINAVRTAPNKGTRMMMNSAAPSKLFILDYTRGLDE